MRLFPECVLVDCVLYLSIEFPVSRVLRLHCVFYARYSFIRGFFVLSFVVGAGCASRGARSLMYSFFMGLFYTFGFRFGS